MDSQKLVNERMAHNPWLLIIKYWECSCVRSHAIGRCERVALAQRLQQERLSLRCVACKTAIGSA